ncbi:hypothetical protein BU15DRAFT_65706 [Melanogaster broomeanus]|nr:hypothetical protein BU15DRAFT_65706 [Melanogaster broomeanus]
MHNSARVWWLDRLTSALPLSPLDEDTLEKILTLVPYLQARVDKLDSYALWIVAHVKFDNFYGQPEARLEANISVHPVQDGDSLCFTFLNFLLFFAPSMHVRELKGVNVDGIINFPRWKGFAKRLNVEWNSFTVYSTVMLAVDATLLAYLGIGLVSVATVATRISVLNVVGSLMSSVLLARQSRVQDDSAFFINNMSCRGGVKTIGIMFSLPFAFLMWALVGKIIRRSPRRSSYLGKATQHKGLEVQKSYNSAVVGLPKSELKMHCECILHHVDKRKEQASQNWYYCTTRDYDKKWKGKRG